MDSCNSFRFSSALLALAFAPGAALLAEEAPPREMAQVPTWSVGDLDYFLHGSMSTEMVPENVLRAFIRTYPDLFPSKDLSHLGLIPDPKFGWPVGFSRKEVPHLGGLPSLGVNCASCHVSEMQPLGGGQPIRVLGNASHFDAEAFFGTVIVATYRTSDPGNMKRFLTAYLLESDPAEGAKAQAVFEAKWKEQEEKINAVLIANPGGSRDIVPGNLHFLAPGSLVLDSRTLATADLPAFVELMLKMFHNMRTSVHLPDKPLDKLPPPSGPGRNDAFGVLSTVLLGMPAPSIPVKFGIVWNLDNRPWVHWDGNTRLPIGRNLLAALGLGAPLVEKKATLDFNALVHHTELTEKIRPPKYPFAIDESLAQRGSMQYQTQCARCHDGPEGDGRLYSPAEIGTAPQRAEGFTKAQADGFNAFFNSIEIPGYTPPKEPAIRSTGKYLSPSLAGVWARAPYLHNGSVRTLAELLTPPAERPKSEHRGSRIYDPGQLGYTDEGPYVLDTTIPTNSNAGHDYGTRLNEEEKRALLEYLKTL